MKREARKKSSFNFAILAVIIIVLVILYILVISPDKSKTPDIQSSTIEKVELWNQKDFSGWTFTLKDSLVDPATVFTHQAGVIRIAGEPFGFMTTRENYRDYKLHVEWRWPEEPTNSGVFLHVSSEDQVWPNTIECQLANGNAGSFVCLGETDLAQRTDKKKRSIPRMEESSEKPAGEWNEYDITSANDSIIIYVNGVLQNIGTQPTVTSGKIALQSEGGPIEFRNVYLIRVK